MRNGGLIGVRREPNPVQASGVWDVQDAYTADRDGVWPRWPGDFGLPLVPGLQFWLEADYGLYTDENATNPALLDGAEVRSWVNRGEAGLIRMEAANNPMILRTNGGDPYLDINQALPTILPVQIKTNNYVFIKSRLATAGSFRFVTTHGLDTSLVLVTTTMESGVSSRFPVSQTTQTQASAASNFAESGQLWASWRARDAIFGNRGVGSAIAVDGGGMSSITGGSTTQPAEGIDIPIGVRALNTTTNLGAAGSKIKALVWYSTDEPLLESQVNAITAYLGGKWSFLSSSAEWA